MHTSLQPRASQAAACCPAPPSLLPRASQPAAPCLPAYCPVPPRVRLRGLGLEDIFADVLEAPLQGLWPTAPFFGLVCYSPEYLHPGQRGPHTDMSSEPQLAMIHFLTDWGATEPGGSSSGGNSGGGIPSDDSGEPSDDSSMPSVPAVPAAPSGGTSFYRERQTHSAHFGRDRCAALPGGSHFCKGSLAYNCSRNRAPADACAGVPNSMSGVAGAYRTNRPSYISTGEQREPSYT